MNHLSFRNLTRPLRLRLGFLAQSQEGAAAIEYALILCVILAVAFVIADTFSIGPVHQRLASAMSGQDVGDADLASGGQNGSSNLEQLKSLDDRALFWKGIAVGLLLLFTFKVVVLGRLMRKKKRKVLDTDADEESIHKLLYEKRQDIYRLLTQQTKYLFNDQLQVDQIMTTQIVAVASNETIDKVIERMTHDCLRHVLVIEKSGKLVGVVSTDDIYLRTPEDRLAKDIMTTDLITAVPGDQVSRVITQVLEKRIDTLPIVDGGKVVGLVTRTDLLLLLQGTLQTLAQPDIHKRLLKERILLPI